jgi:hypothetical protein
MKTDERMATRTALRAGAVAPNFSLPTTPDQMGPWDLDTLLDALGAASLARGA